jgi:hypothetical protein
LRHMPAPGTRNVQWHASTALSTDPAAERMDRIVRSRRGDSRGEEGH